MNLTHQHLAHIRNCLDLARIAGIDHMIIANDSIRGISEDKAIAIINDCAGAREIELPFTGDMAVVVDLLRRKLEILDTIKDVSVSVDIEETNGFVKSIIFANNGTSFNNICCNPAVVQSPKRVNDVFKNTVIFPAGSAELLVRASKICKSESITIAGDTKGATITLKDQMGNTYNQLIDNQPYKKKFSNRYVLKRLIPLFKINPEATTVEIGDKGVMRIAIKGLDVYCLPLR